MSTNITNKEDYEEFREMALNNLTVYFVDADVYDDDNHPTALSDEQFKNKSYTSCSLEEFVNQINEDLSVTYFIRIL